jgi:hypothetical protein
MGEAGHSLHLGREPLKQIRRSRKRRIPVGFIGDLFEDEFGDSILLEVATQVYLPPSALASTV